MSNRITIKKPRSYAIAVEPRPLTELVDLSVLRIGANRENLDTAITPTHAREVAAALLIAADVAEGRKLENITPSVSVAIEVLL